MDDVFCCNYSNFLVVFLYASLIEVLFLTGRTISPIIEELSGQYPHVKTYKVDIDKVGKICVLGDVNLLIKLKICGSCFNFMVYNLNIL